MLAHVILRKIPRWFFLSDGLSFFLLCFIVWNGEVGLSFSPFFPRDEVLTQSTRELSPDPGLAGSWQVASPLLESEGHQTTR